MQQQAESLFKQRQPGGGGGGAGLGCPALSDWREGPRLVWLSCLGPAAKAPASCPLLPAPFAVSDGATPPPLCPWGFHLSPVLENLP